MYGGPRPLSRYVVCVFVPQVLDIDLEWRMHKVSDGQRRRVQICMGLLRPFKVLLLDEITVDLDVVGRADLMNFLKKECEERGACILYATHIFDGLESWPSHLAYVARGRLQFFKPVADIPELQSMTLMRSIEKWLRVEVEEERRKRKERKAKGLPEYEYDIGTDGTRVAGGDPGRAAASLNNGWGGGRMNPTVKLDDGSLALFGLSSNTVLRT